jgi:small subunit ribosomal protein S7
MKMMREACRLKSKGGNMTFEEALANEFILAARNEGTTIKEKQEHHKLCDANRAFAHYRK